MKIADPTAFADRKSRLRPALTAVCAVAFLAGQALARPGFGASYSHARAIGWAVEAAVMLLLLLPAAGFMWGRRVRELINDEVVRHHLRAALTWGFWLSMILALGLFLLPVSEGWTARQGIVVILTPTIGATLLRFAWLDSRGQRDG